MTYLNDLGVEIYADGADIRQIKKMLELPVVRGFTTNPTLMRAAGVENYEAFVQDVLAETGHMPVSFEVIADDLAEMERQARTLASWGGSQIYVKIPVTTTTGESTASVVSRLVADGVGVNVTAVFTPNQVSEIVEVLGQYSFRAIISVFAGRIANAGVDPSVIMRSCHERMAGTAAKLLWASPRQVFDVVAAHRSRADIITLTPALINQLSTLGKDLNDYSLETVKMFHTDALAAGYVL